MRINKIDIELTNICNLKCNFCSHEKITREKGFMPFALFKKIVDEIDWKIDEFVIAGFGEPLLDSNIFEKVKYARKLNCIIRLYTNGLLLTEEKFKQLVESGLDSLIISCYATNKEEYKKFHNSDNFDKVRTNIIKLKEIRKSMEVKNPLISLNPIEDIIDKKRYISCWNPFVDIIVMKNLHNLAYGKNFNDVKKGKRLSCMYPFFVLEITWNGNVRICCADYDGKIIIGNLQKQSIKEIMQSQKYKEIMNIHEKGQFEKIAICDNCDQLVPSNLRNVIARKKFLFLERIK